MMTRREPDLWPTILAVLVGSVVAITVIGGLIGVR